MSYSLIAVHILREFSLKEINIYLRVAIISQADYIQIDSASNKDR